VHANFEIRYRESKLSDNFSSILGCKSISYRDKSPVSLKALCGDLFPCIFQNVPEGSGLRERIRQVDDLIAFLRELEVLLDILLGVTHRGTYLFTPSGLVTWEQD
jgi:hypothetical protein